MKKRKYKIDWLKLVSFIIGIITSIYLVTCIVSYTTRTTKAVKNYEPQERTMAIK